MQKKAQTGMIGTFIVLLTMVVIGTTLLIQVAQDIGDASNQMTYNSTDGSNAEITMPANGAAIDLTGQEYFSDIALNNGTGAEGAVPAGNFTIGEYVSNTTGVKTIYLQNDADDYASETLNISYVYGDDGYIENSGARSVAGMIVIFFALAIAVIALEPTIRSGILNKMGI